MRTLPLLPVLAATLLSCADSHPTPPSTLESRRDGLLTPGAVTLLRDINPKASQSTTSPAIEVFAATRQYLFFVTGSGLADHLWRTDGTAQGTVLLRDLDVDVDGHLLLQELTAYNDRVFFTGDDGASGTELWTSDGTPEGTRMVKELNPGPAGVTLKNFTATAGWLYFTSTLDNVTELWRTDGSADGTVRVLRFGQGTAPAGGAEFTALGSTLFFRGYQASTSTYGLWKTDGTEAGTVRVAAASGPGQPNTLTPAGNLLYYFNAGTVYRTDGTPEGTWRLVTPQGGAFSDFKGLTALGTRAFFRADDSVNKDALWQTDGTPEGTRIFSTAIGATFPSLHLACGPYVYFYGVPAATSERWLWRTDGTVEGTQRLVQVYQIERSACAGGRFYFVNDDSRFAGKLYASNGTPEGTVTLKDLDGQDYFRSAQMLTPWGDSLIFYYSPGTSSDIWRSNGTPAGTTELPWPPRTVPESTRVGLWRELNGKLLFTADEPVETSLGTTYVHHLWTTDGTPAGTSRLDAVVTNPPSTGERTLEVVGTRAFFVGEVEGHGPELWVTDGSNLGTREVKDIGSGGFSGFPRYFTALNGLLYFQAGDRDTAGPELWRSDGTSQGTWMVRDILQGTEGSTPEHLVALGGFIYFAATDAASGRELWRTDGTFAGTVRVADLFPGTESSEPKHLTVFGGKLYFTAEDSSGAREVWRLDSGGPVRLSALRPSFMDDAPRDLIATSSALYFAGMGFNDEGTELYRVDGDTVVRLADILPGGGGSNPKPLAVSGGVLYFAATDAAHGRELWRTDGTPEGTRLVRDMAPGPESSFTRQGYRGDALTLSDGKVLFAAIQPGEGRELWWTDGTEAGTQPVLALEPGPMSSHPVLLKELGGRVLLHVAAPMTGAEVRSFVLAVLNDKAPPVLLGCPNITAEATSARGTSVSYQVSTTDDSGAAVALSSAWPSGSVFPVATTEFEITATDIAGNTTRCSARVQVRDTIPPSVRCPSSFAVQAPGPSGATPEWTLPRAVDAVGTPTVTASHAPGSLLPIGVNEITVTATDPSGNAASCRFTITVNAKPQGPTAPDAGTPPDAGPGPETPPADGPDETPQQGCGCASGTGTLSLLAWSALGLLLRRRRR